MISRRETLDIRPWMLPVIVIALAVPITSAGLLLGPIGALGAGFLATAAIAVIAIRARGDGEIEVAPSPDQLYRALVVCAAPIERRADAIRVAELIAGNATAFEGTGESLVMVPAINSALAEWLSDVDEARAEAYSRLTLSLAHLSAVGVDARGEVGDPPIVEAVEDALGGFPARDLVLVAPMSEAEAELAELRRRLDRPVLEVDITLDEAEATG